MLGSLQTFWGGIEGRLILVEGKQGDKIIRSDYSQIAVTREGVPGRERAPLKFPPFQPGPVDWPDGRTLDLGSIDGVNLKVLKYYSHARVVDDWIADETQRFGPAIRYAIVSPQGKSMLEGWLSEEPNSLRSFSISNCGGRRWIRCGRISRTRPRKKRMKKASFRCITTAGCNAFRSARTSARKFPSATARSKWKSPSIMPTRRSSAPFSSSRRATSLKIRCWSY